MKLDQYLRIPYTPQGRSVEGIDCWGLVMLYHLKTFGYELPEHPTHPDNLKKMLREFKLETENNPIWNEVLIPQHGTIVAAGQGKGFHHVGVFLEDANSILHTYKEAGRPVSTPIHRFRIKWPLVKFYNYIP